jgi:hypothetical protein
VVGRFRLLVPLVVGCVMEGGTHMRKTVLPILVLVAVGAALAVGSAGAKPGGGGTAVVDAPVTGTFTPRLGTEPVPFAGTLTVDRFVATDGQLALEGVVAATDPDGLFAPLAVTVTAVAAPSADPTTGGCTVTVGTAIALVLRDFILVLDGQAAMFRFGEPGEPGSDTELCRVARASDKDPTDLNAVARALNKALGLG